MQVIVERADGVKCPRCWKYHGIPDNFMGMCDACCSTLIECDLYEFPEVDMAAVHSGIRESRRIQQAKYGSAV